MTYNDDASARASNTVGNTAKLQNALDRALSDLSNKDAEIARLKAQIGAAASPTIQPKTKMHTPRSKAQAVRDLKELLADPMKRGNDDFESELDCQVSAMLQLQDELKQADQRSEEQTANQMLEDFEQHQSSQPLAHACEALNLSRARAQLLQAQEHQGPGGTRECLCTPFARPHTMHSAL
eukprot:Tamp_24833.p1 GENE.Tamp_24833~~Tamp_24833.p1  ORF type:complete len:181 (+),score=36.89 Tamp_24833:163-705(+)